MNKVNFYDLAIIGGGVTGLGIARKAAMQGLKVVLIERDEIGSGTSGHFHELLHSGARYAVHDPEAAKECYEENQRLCSSQSFVKNAINQTGGLFLALTESDVEYSEKLILSCHKIGIPIIEFAVDKVIREVPPINKTIKRALYVPDAYINGKEVLAINKKIAQEHGATFIMHHRVIGFKEINNRIETIIVQNRKGEQTEISSNFVINAAGVWSGQISKLIGIEIPLIPYRGALLILKERFSNYVLNRCHKPFNGDIFVPASTHTIFGTTAKKTEDLDNFIATDEEIKILMHEGEQLIPELSSFHIIEKYAGVRPLYSSFIETSDGREISRSFAVINHKDTGIKNFITIVGGKFTIYERMGDKALDVMKENLLLS